MSHPLTACISEIELLQERIAEKNDRIEALEVALMAEWAARNNHIEALEAEVARLEAALREIADPLMPHQVDGVGRAWEQATIQTMQKIARAALAPPGSA